MVEMKAHELEEKLCAKQAERLSIDQDPQSKSLRRTFMQLFTTRSLGLGVLKKGIGKRNSQDQSNFRSNLITSYDAAHPNPQSDTLWCPITKQYHDSPLITASHIFAYRHGQKTMTTIFDLETSSDLFSPLNGLLMHKTAENMFDKGYFVIVPYIPTDSPYDEPSVNMIKAWHENEPKEFRIRICERDGSGMNKFISGVDGPTWNDLDGSKLVSKSNARPRARFLYFHYCTTILRRSWHQSKVSQVLRDKLGKLYWGTPGRFMAKNMLLAFVEEMEHDYENLLEGAAGESGEVEAVETALAAANHQISSRTDQEVSDNESEDEEEENEKE